MQKGLFGLLALAAIAVCGCSEPSVEVRSLVHLSPVYTVDREYRSMKGPSSTQTVLFPESDFPELLWITGYRAEMVDAEGENPMPQEFMCHSNLDFDAARHSRLHELPLYHTDRLFTLSQGQLEIELPEGFGLPYFSDEPFSLATQVLNLNPDETTREVRHRVTIDYVRDRDLTEPMKPLFMTSGWGLVLLDGDGGHFGVADPEESEHGPGCLPGEAAGFDLFEDDFKREFSGHWVVKPGRQVYPTLVTHIMKLPYDTTVHYIAVHLHPFAESLELIDLTNGESVFKSRVEGFEDKIGIERVDYFTSQDGIPLYKDHDYELVSTYNNTTAEDQDSMAVMLLYLLDKQFKKIERAPRPDVEIKRVKRPVRLSDERIVLHTSVGDVTLALYPDVAPDHVEQILNLVRMKVYDTTRFHCVKPGAYVQTGFRLDRTGPPLTADQKQAIRALEPEVSDLEHERGIVSMPIDAQASFSILLGTRPGFDGRNVVIGEVTDGFDTLAKMVEVPRNDKDEPLQRIGIVRAEVLDAE